VRRGQVIARMGDTGRATGPNLHFEVLLHDKAVDPLTYIGQ
jgi:murein DD-endopeptidase MepM/ murein hydrolase activator NlpD